MDEGKFAADFVSANLGKIVDLVKSLYSKADATLQVSLLQTAYTDYLNASRLKYSKTKSFFIRNQPVELYSYYVPTGIRCADKTINYPDIKSCTEFTNRIVILGSGGSGKSVLMRHLFLNSIESKVYTPILVELRDLNGYEKSLDEFLAETLTIYGFKASDEYIKKALEAGHFCYFFDGFDEVTPKLRVKIIKQIQTLSRRYPKCAIFLSSRPDDNVEGLEDFSTFQMLPLALAEATELVSKLPTDEVIKRKFTENLKLGLFEKHKSFLSNPLLLSIMLLTYGENAEIPTKLSIFYNQAFEALFKRHDAYKGAFNRDRLSGLDIQDFSRVFSLFCLQTYDKRLFKMSKTVCLEYLSQSITLLNLGCTADNFLSDLLSATCLMIEDGLEVTFSHRSFQEYFVALFISTASPDYQVKLIDRYWTNMRSDNVMDLLLEINPELYERSLVLPKLEVFFNNLKIKKTVGITHFLRYVKYMYSEFINILHDDDIGFTFKNVKNDLNICENNLLRYVADNYSSFKRVPEVELKKHRELMRLKYFSNADRDYKTSNFRLSDQVLKDINSSDGFFSVHYLSCGFEGYKKLKSKHTNSAQTFDLLLGIKK